MTPAISQHPRWVCLSDTHFGAENSLLTSVDAGGDVDPSRPSPVLQQLLACLRDLLRRTGDGRRPTLVLNGDILELALAEDQVAAMTFERFVELAFDPSDPLFAPVILYVPGNHDHHMWETARERMYCDYVMQLPPDKVLAPPWHATHPFPGETTRWPEAELLTALARRHSSEARVEVVYPNLALSSAGSVRQVIVHHGHFTESIYRLLSTGKEILFPEQRPATTVWEWESDNFAWIDFFWSALGRSGSAGRDVGLIYDMLQDERAMRCLSGELGGVLGSHGRAPFRWLERWASRRVVSRVAQDIARRERAHPEVALTPAGRTGLFEYLSGPVSDQFARYRSGFAGDEVSFLFGHTHKPFEEEMRVPGFTRPVQVFNSGGWVVDRPDTTPCQGAAVLVVDGDCQVASLRLYNQHADAASYRVTVAGIGNGRQGDLRSKLAEAVRAAARPWADFSTTVAQEVALRQRLLPQIVARGLELTGCPQPGPPGGGP